jgi:hypothetical protein
VQNSQAPRRSSCPERYRVLPDKSSLGAKISWQTKLGIAEFSALLRNCLRLRDLDAPRVRHLLGNSLVRAFIAHPTRTRSCGGFGAL